MDRRPCRIAAIVALAIMVGSGVGYRALASRVADLFAIPPFPPGTLSHLPLRVGDWIGHDEPLSERIVEVVDADDHINRIYARGEREVVSFFLAMRRRDIAYGVPTRELVPHRPDVCYPVFGWKPDGDRTVELTAADGSPLPVRILRFRRGELDTQRVAVLVYYIVDGQRGHSPGKLRPRGWLPKGNVRYVAQVEIACPAGAFGVSAEESICAFAAESAPGVLKLIARTVEGSADREPGQSTSVGG